MPQRAPLPPSHWGQALYVLAEQKRVIVRCADDRDHSGQHNSLLQLARAVFAPECGSLMVYLRNPDRQQAGSCKGLSV